MVPFTHDCPWLSVAALFLCVGYLYDRYKTRNLFYYRFSKYYAIYAIFFFFLMLANIGFPPTQFCF
jgi:NADH:ubiquinone oxidoreductase subunit 4 (subunit M)